MKGELMKKKIAILLLVGILAGATGAYGVSNEQISINGSDVKLGTVLNSSTGKVMVTLRDVAVLLKGQLAWDSATSMAVLTLGDSQYGFKNGTAVVVNKAGIPVSTMSSAAITQDGKMSVPLNALVDVFNKHITIAEDRYVITDLQGDFSETIAVTDLVAKALVNSDAYEAALLAVKQNDLSYEDSKDGLKNSSPYDTGNDAEAAKRFQAYQTYYSSGISLEVAKRASETQKTKIENAVLADVESILLGMEKQADLEKQLAYSEKTLSQNELKLQLGLLSTTDTQTARLAHDKLKETLSIQKSSTQKAWENLNHLVGRDLTDRYNINYDKTYEAFVGNIDEIYTRSIEESPDIYSLEKQIDLAQNSVKYYVFNMGSGSVGYQVNEIDVTMAKVDLEKAKKGYKETIITYLNSIETLELTRSQLLIQTQSAQLALDKVYKNYQVGLATALDYESAQLAVNSLKSSLMETEFSHSQAVRKVNKLWVSN